MTSSTRRSPGSITDWSGRVHIDQSLFRPGDPTDQCGDVTRAHDLLDWSPTVTFEELVGRMVDADLAESGPDGIVEP